MIVIFRFVALDRRILKDVLHHAATWETSKSGYMFAISWSLKKGDWWKDKAELKAKFISYNWFKKSGVYVRTGLYIGRLAIVWQTRPKAIKSTEPHSEAEAV